MQVLPKKVWGAFPSICLRRFNPQHILSTAKIARSVFRNLRVFTVTSVMQIRVYCRNTCRLTTTRKKLRKQHQCELCEKRFPNRFYLKKHITSAHSKKKTHPCETSTLSEKTTHQSELLEERSPTGSYPKRYIASANSENKTQQCETRVPSKKTTHQCELCKKHFSIRSHLKRHMKSAHSKKKPYQGEDCIVEDASERCGT